MKEHIDLIYELIKATTTRVNEHQARITQLEKLVHYPASLKTDVASVNARLKEQAAQHQAMTNRTASGPELHANLYAPLRNDTKAVLDLAAFARRLLDPQDLGHAVSFEVRQAARRALGLQEVQGGLHDI